MSADLFSRAPWLQASNNAGYGLLPIPSSQDSAIDTLLGEWIRYAPDDRASAARNVSDDQHATLMAYAERTASRAVRESRREWVLLGLVAQALSDQRGDWRENVLLLGLLYDACLRIGCSPDEVFREAAEYLTPSVASRLTEFLRRKPEDRSLEAMGYEESADADGFRYRRTW